MTAVLPDIGLIDHLDWEPACTFGEARNDPCGRTPVTHRMWWEHCACLTAIVCDPCAAAVAAEIIDGVLKHYSASCITCGTRGILGDVRVTPLGGGS